MMGLRKSIRLGGGGGVDLPNAYHKIASYYVDVINRVVTVYVAVWREIEAHRAGLPPARMVTVELDQTVYNQLYNRKRQNDDPEGYGDQSMRIAYQALKTRPEYAGATDVIE